MLLNLLRLALTNSRVFEIKTLRFRNNEIVKTVKQRVNLLIFFPQNPNLYTDSCMRLCMITVTRK